MIKKKKNECPKCGKVYLLPGSLKTHLLSHVNDDMNTCSECLRTFVTEVQLEEHTAASHLKDYNTDVEALHVRKSKTESHSKDVICSPSSKDQTGRYLKELVKIYQKLLKCPRCPMTFIAQTELESHLSIHSYDNRTCEEFCGESNSLVDIVSGKGTKSKDFTHSPKGSPTISSKLVTDIRRTVLNNNTEVRIQSEAKLQDLKEVRNVITSNFTNDSFTSKTPVQTSSYQDYKSVLQSRKTLRCPKTWLSKSEMETKTLSDTSDCCIKDITLELGDITNSSLTRSFDSTTEHITYSKYPTKCSPKQPYKTDLCRFKSGKGAASQTGCYSRNLCESVDDINNLITADSSVASSFLCLLENKLTVGSDGTLGVLEADESEDYCTLFKCLMCPMIFLVETEIDNHLHLHADDIKINCGNPWGHEEDSENVKISEENSASTDFKKVSKSLAVKVMEDSFRIHLAKVYQRYYKCIKCPMVFLTKAEVQNHRFVVDLHKGIVVNSDIVLDKDVSVSIFENLSEAVEILGKNSQAQNHETDHSMVYCPVFQCLKCEMAFLTKTEFEKHSSVHEVEISSLVDLELSNLEVKNSVKDSFENGNISTNQEMSYLSCSVCGKKFNDRKKFFDHKRIHGIKKFECKECGKKFRANSYLKKHMEVHSRPYKCTECNKTFKSDYVLELHQAMHSDARPYECTECGNMFRNKISLTLHSYDHLTNGPFNCEICKNYFDSSQLLKTHMRTHLKESPEEEASSFVCTKCSKTFTDKKKFQHHMRCHFKKVPYKCKYCNKTFFEKYLLTRHRRLHSGDPPFKCIVCQKVLSTKSSLVNHLDTHASNKQYLCHICGISLNQRSSYYSHMKKHTGVMHHKCNLCEKRFFYKCSYRRHMSMHFGKKPYQCELCGKRFKQGGHLKSHSVTHTGEKPHQCTTCNKSFTQKSSLKIHQLSHSGSQYACPECGRTFTQKYALLKHLKYKSQGKFYWCKVCRKLFTRRACLIHHKNSHLQGTCVINFDGQKEIIETFVDCADEHKEIIITQANLCESGEEIVETQAVTFDCYETQAVTLDSHGNEVFALDSHESQTFDFNSHETQDLDFNSHNTKEFHLDSHDTQGLILDYHADQESNCSTTPTIHLDSHGTDAITLDSYETQALALDTPETHDFAFDIKGAQAFGFNIPGSGPLNFNDQEEIIVTPMDRVESDSETIQVHLIW